MNRTRVTEAVKQRPRARKRDDESFDDLLERPSRSKKRPLAIAESPGDYDEEKCERMDEAHEAPSEPY